MAAARRSPSAAAPTRRATDPSQGDLLAWEPPATTVAFDEREVRAVSLAARLSRAVSVALPDCGLPREEVARRMGEYLGRPVSKAMLGAYASAGRDEHAISAPRLLALVHATRDRRLLELLAEPFGWAVVERRHLEAIELASVREKQDELRRHVEALARRLRAAGGL